MVMECKDTARKSHYPKDGPFEVPEGWVWTRLCDITELIEDCPHSTAKDEGAGFALIRTPNVGEGHLILDGVHRVSESVYNKRNTRAIPTEGDIIYAREAPAGNAAVIRKGELVCLGQRTVLIRPVKQFVDTKLLTYFILSTNSRNRLISTAVGSTAAHVNLETIRPFLIPLPPINEQKGIVVEIEKWLFIISSLQDSIASVNNTIQSTKKKILDLAIHGKLVPQDPSDEPAIELLKRINPDFKPSDNLHYEGELPNGWCFSTIGDLFRHNTGKALNGKDQVGEELRYITTSNLYWDRFDLNEVRTMPFTEAEKEKCRATKGDLLVCEGGDVGRAAIWPHDFDVMIQNHIHRLRPREDISVRFYYYIFLLYKQMGLIGGKGIAILGLSSRELDKMVVPVPPVPEQHRIVTVIENLFAQMDALISNLS